jgi:toxin ParE1/3/4
MARRLIRSSESLRDVIELSDYIARDSLDAAFRFLDAIESTCRFLARNSAAGQLCRFDNPETEGIRVWTVDGFRNHLIFYRETDAEVVVERVLQGSRDLESLFGK